MIWWIIGYMIGGLIALAIWCAIMLWLFKEFWKAKYAVEDERKERDILIERFKEIDTPTVKQMLAIYNELKGVDLSSPHKKVKDLLVLERKVIQQQSNTQ